MNNVQFKYSNLSRIKEIIKKYVVKREESKKFKGRPSFDKPWEKGMLFTPKKINIPEVPYAYMVLKRPRFNATRNFLVCHEATIGDDEMLYKAYQLAKALKERGIKKGDNVCLSMNEAIEASIVEAACSFIGAVSINLPSNSSKDGIKEFLQEFNCKYYFVSDEYRKMAEEATIDIPDLKKCIVPTGLSFKGLNNLSNETIEWLSRCKDERPLESNEETYESVYKSGCESKITNVIEKLKIDDPAKVLFTSGTTGKPKPILLSNGNINAELIRLKNQTHMNLGPKGVCLKVVADMYPYGNIVSKWFPMFVGKCVGLTPTLNARNADYYLYKYLPVFVQAIPSFFRNLRGNEIVRKLGLKFMKYAVSGGEKYETEDKKEDNAFLKEMGSPAVIQDGAGVSEGVACATTAVGSKYNIESVGRPMVGVNIKIIEDDDTKPYIECQEKTYNENGLICYSGATIMLGYYNQPEKTSKVTYYDEYGNRWYVSDAIGHIDEKGYLYIVARKARCFTAYDEENGQAYKLSPEEVESVLASNPITKDVVALPMTIRDENGIENKVVKLYVRLEDGQVLTDGQKDQILECCRNSKLAKCSIPRKIVQWTGDWPRLNGEGSKINYKALQEYSDAEENEFVKSKRL